VALVKKINLKEGIKQQLKALLDFLENNQIRLPDALKEIERRIVIAQDYLPLETSLLIFIGMIETINKFLSHKEIESDEDEQQLTTNAFKMDHQMLSRVIQALQ
jgi:hypothetical protein